MFSSASSVIALAGTCLLLSLPNHLMVIPSCEMPYSAREPSAVAVFMASTIPAHSEMIASPARKLAEQDVQRLGHERVEVAST